MSEIQKPETQYSVADMEALLCRAFPEDDPSDPILGIDDDTVVAANLSALLTSPDTTIGTSEEDGRLVGLSVAIPIDRMDPARYAEAESTAYVYYTAVEPTLQGAGIVGDVSDNLFAVLKGQGFTHVEQDCMVANGYADKVSKIYKDAIVNSEDHDRWGIGLQRFFRIKLVP